jgi:hypothetical protein
MTVSPIAQQIISQIERFSPEQQRRVLDFVRSLARPVGRPGKDVLYLVGTIDLADLDIMRQVADEECEGIDSDDW